MAHTPTLTLVCNSHIDPVWLWPWEEGLAATLATFRSAAALCERFDDFVFCHNEALLYMWVEEHEPALFRRIQELVARGRWHVMGGWYLQPDCNLPAGESLVRQVLVGKRYFLEKFGVEPRVAVNVDSFGHTRGLVQILAKSGYDGYLFCRPDAAWLELPASDFTWVGFDGSTVLAHRADEHYNSELGQAAGKIERWLTTHADTPTGLLLWGVGNHGGGPSRNDLETIASLRATHLARRISHGTPEGFFGAVASAAGARPRVERDLNPWAVGCYTSMAAVKQAHARLERLLFATEGMLANAAILGRLAYPASDLRICLEDVLYCQFHDILPGEGVAKVEEQALARLGHGMEILGRLRCRAFFAALDGQPAAADGEYPLFVYNHHPFPVARVVECEFQPPEPNVDRTVFWQPRLADAAGIDVPLQLEKESCNIQSDQRKRVVFTAALAPSSVTRFACRLETVPRAASRAAAALDGNAPLSPNPAIEVSRDTGLLTRFAVGGVEFLRGPAFRPVLMADTADPWGMKARSFTSVAEEFRLMTPGEAAAFAGVADGALPPVRIVERGPIRTVVEALFSGGRSAIAIRYLIPAGGTEVEIRVRVAWFERDRLLKLVIPTRLSGGAVYTQTAYGVERIRREGEELCGHRWAAMVSPDGRHAITLVNDRTYGFDASNGELRPSLLRAPAYAGHPVDDVTPIVRQDRYERREDQGEHEFRFWLNAGPAAGRLAAIDREVSLLTEDMMRICAFPSGDGETPLPGITLGDDVVRLAALKMSEDGRRIILRLFEPTGQARTTRVSIPALALDFALDLRPFELRTLAVELDSRVVTDTDLLERPQGRS